METGEIDIHGLRATSHIKSSTAVGYYFSTSLRAAASSPKEPSGVKAWQTARPSRGRGESGTKRSALLECLSTSSPAAFPPRARRTPQHVGPCTSSFEAIADGLVVLAKCEHKITVMIAGRRIRAGVAVSPSHDRAAHSPDRPGPKRCRGVSRKRGHFPRCALLFLCGLIPYPARAVSVAAAAPQQNKQR